MKNLIFFTGRFRIDQLGAISVITQNLFFTRFKNIQRIIIGLGRLFIKINNPKEIMQFNLLNSYLRKNRINRVGIKLCNLIFPRSQLNLNVKDYFINRMRSSLEKVALKQIIQLQRQGANNGVVVGLSANSLSIGLAAKKLGYRYALHAQWCHPVVQNTLVAQGFKHIGFNPPVVSKKQINKQLLEYELADIIWCPSKFVQLSLVNNGVPPQKTFVGHLGVDVDSFRVPQNARSTDGPLQILSVGTVCIQKGVHVLLDALLLADLRDSTMIFNGQTDPTAMALIRKYEPKLAKKNITIRVDPGDPRRNHKTSSVFVLSSLHDAYGIVIPEAMAAGLPIIISDRAGANEIVEHGKNGFVFTSGDSEQLAEHLEYFQKNPEEQYKFGKASETMSRQYDLNYTSQHILPALM